LLSRHTLEAHVDVDARKEYAMDMDDLMKQAQGALKNVSDEQLEQGADAVKDKTPDQFDSFVDKAADFLESQNDK